MKRNAGCLVTYGMAYRKSTFDKLLDSWGAKYLQNPHVTW